MIDQIVSWTDGDSGYLKSIGKFRMARTKTPEKYDASYNLAKRTAEHLAPIGQDIDVKVVGRDQYGRKLVELQKTGKNINTAMMNKFAMFQGQR